MSKMLEAWKKFCDTETDGPTGNFEFDLFAAGYQAAIAAIREGGAQLEIGSVQGQTAYAFSLNGVVPIVGTKLYKLPDDLT